MFEAADPAVFGWCVKNYGPEVNLFVDHSQIVQLECLRSGIWATKSAGCLPRIAAALGTAHALESGRHEEGIGPAGRWFPAAPASPAAGGVAAVP